MLNTINFKKSMKYNPFAYLRSEKDILKLVNTLIANTKGDGEKAGEDFWIKSERLFYCALIGYIWYEAPEEEKNFTTLLEMINASEAREDDPEFQSPVDLMFERLEEKDPEHFAVRQYKKFLLSAGKTRSSKLLYAELFKTEDKKRCTECGTFFVSKSNSVKYCPDCRKRITRRQAAERMRKRRAAVTR